MTTRSLVFLFLLASAVAAGADGWDDRFRFLDAEVERGLPSNRDLLVDGFDGAGSWSCAISPDEGMVQGRDFALPGQGEAFGIRVDFFRRASSSVTIRPRHPIAIPGTCLRVSVRALGRSFSHRLSVLVLDYYGRVRELPMGRMNFSGWKTLEAWIPRAEAGGGYGIVQDDPHYQRPGGLRVAGLRISFEADEAYGRFYAYFSELRALTEIIGFEPAEAAAVAPEERPLPPHEEASVTAAPRAADDPPIPEPVEAPPSVAPTLPSATVPEAETAKEARILGLLNAKIAASQSYPIAARRRGIEGRVVATVSVGGGGEYLGSSLASSSGSDILDRAALDLLAKAFPVENDTGRRLSLRISIVYRLAAP